MVTHQKVFLEVLVKVMIGVVACLPHLMAQQSVVRVQGAAFQDPAAKAQIVEQIAKAMQENYVFEELGIKAGEFLKNQLAGHAYDAISQPQALAEKLTEDLQSVCSDRHLRVRYRPPGEDGQRRGGDPILDALERREALRERNMGFSKVEILSGNVGYVDVRGFPNREDMAPVADHAMGLLQRVDALILDLRNNGGGSPSGIQYLCSYFFEGGVHLNSIYWRNTGKTIDFITVDELPVGRLIDVPMVVLTSHFTFSGGEECAYNLLTQKRATLVGEVTGGGANPGGPIPVGPGFTVFVPNGRAINPITGTNWEGVGVQPDIEVSADDAYAKGVELARKEAQKVRAKRRQVTEKYTHALDEAIEQARSHFSSGEEKRGMAVIQKALGLGFDQAFINEAMVNNLGYTYLSQEALPLAEAIMRGNAERFPQSANVYDSLGDVLDRRGKVDEAIAAYSRAVDIGVATDSPLLETFRANLARVKDKK